MIRRAASPEQLEKLRELIEATKSNSSQSRDWIDSLAAIGDFIAVAGWPLIVLFALFLFRRPISRITSLGYGDWKLDFDRKLRQAGERASAESTDTLRAGPSAAEIANAGELDGLAHKVELSDIRRSALELGADYERVRASMSSGDLRTRRMEIVVSKMRTLGRAVIPLRHELMASPSPGQRLVAVASLQVAPDFEALGWLANRFSEERPFIAYHCAVALLVAARDSRAVNCLNELEVTALRVAEAEARLQPDTDRATTLREFRTAVQDLRKRAPNSRPAFTASHQY